MLRLETARGELVRLAHWPSPSGDGPRCVRWGERHFVMVRRHALGGALKYREIVWDEAAQAEYRPRELGEEGVLRA